MTMIWSYNHQTIVPFSDGLKIDYNGSMYRLISVRTKTVLVTSDEEKLLIVLIEQIVEQFRRQKDIIDIMELAYGITEERNHEI